MGARLTARLLILLVVAWAAPVRGGEAGPWVFLAETRLNPGAVPELHFASWPVDRTAAVFVRTGAGRVVALELEDGLVVRVRAGPERRFWIGGSSGYFAAPRTGLQLDREALIVLAVAGKPADFSGLAPVAGKQVPERAPPADLFFRRLAEAPWVDDVEIHIVPYEIRALGGARDVPEDTGVERYEDLMLAFPGIPLHRALIFADVLAVETGLSPAPLRVRRAGSTGALEVPYRSLLNAEKLARRIEGIAADLDAEARPVTAHWSERTVTVSVSSAPGQ